MARRERVKFCVEAREHFSEHLDGDPVSFSVRFHLAVCPPCRRVARSLRAAREALGALRDLEPPPPPPQKEPDV